MGVVQEIQSDLEAAAVRLFSEYRHRLMAEARRLCSNVTDAEDLVMVTFDTVLREIESYDAKRGEFYGWMVGVMRRVQAKSNRRLVNRGTAPVDPSVMTVLAGSDEEALSRVFDQCDHDALRKAIDGLDSEYKQVLVLRYFKDFSLKQIAALVRQPIGTISWRLSVARQMLAAKLDDRLGKKPVAVVLALLLVAATLFGAVKYIVQLESETENKEDQTTMNIKSAGKSLALASVLTAGATFGGTTYYLSESGDDAKDGKSVETALRTWKAGIAKLSSEGDELVLLKGTYVVSETNTLRNVANLVIRGATGNRDDVIVDCGASGKALLRAQGQRPTGLILRDLTICNGLGVSTWHSETLVSNVVYEAAVAADACAAFRLGPNARVIDSVFRGNRGTGGNGGALACAAGADFVRCSFVDNVAAGEGGAVMLNDDGGTKRASTFSDCGFTNNLAGSFGGAVSGGFMTGGVVRCTFVGNVSSNGESAVNTVARGGAVSLWGAAAGQDTLFKNCIFASNVVYGAQGGALYANQGGIHLEDCSFVGNEVRSNGAYATMGGGAIALVKLNHSQQSTFGLHVKADRCKFVGNRSQGSSGAIDFENAAGLNGAGTYTTVRNCLFDGNECTGSSGYGGVMYSKYQFEMSNCTLVNNRSAYGAGCIYLADARAYAAGITNCAFGSNWDPGNLSHSRVRRDLCWSDTSSSWYSRGFVLYNCFEYKDDPNATYVIDINDKTGAKRNFTSETDPFADSAAQDYSLAKGSELVNAGTNQVWMLNARDIRNRGRYGRIAQGVVDIGCFEYWPFLGMMLLLK